MQQSTRINSGYLFRPEGFGLVIRPAFKEAVMVRLVPLAGVLGLAVVLLAGCGAGGNDQAKVEANLQDYVNAGPDQTGFPIGLGLPKVKANSCRDRHVRLEKGDVIQANSFPTGRVTLKRGGALWGCVVKIGTYVARVNVFVVDRTRVLGEWEGELFRGKCLADQKAKGTPESRAYVICIVTLRRST
jgi:hypothetical protein